MIDTTLLKKLPRGALLLGKFLHLIEDNLEHISITGITSWITTYGTWVTTVANLHLHLPWQTQAAAVGANAAALAAHTVKRSQLLKANPDAHDTPAQPANTPAPLWSGEEV